MCRNTPSYNRLDKRRLVGFGGFTLAGLILLVALALAFVQKGSPGIGKRPLAAGLQPPVTCTTPQHTPGDATGTISSGGLNRSFLVHLAPSYGKGPQPLVLNYHGYSWTSQVMEQTSHMNREADKAGFVLVFPQGIGSPPSWNAGVGAYGPTGDTDDIQFTRDLLDYLEKNYCIDAHRVYVTGFSLGGGMVYRLACALSDRITAAASVSGAYYPIPEGCQPARPIPILEIHGAADQLAPYDGNTATRMGAVQDYLNGWLDRDKCDKNRSRVFFQQGDVTGTEWEHCAAGVMVRHYRISDGGHTWPGSPNTTHVIDGSVVIWDFFSQFSLASAAATKH